MRLFFSLIMAVMVNVVMVKVVMGFVYAQLLPRENDLGDGCYYHGELFNNGQNWPGENCTELSCSQVNETTYMVTTVGCGTVTILDLKPNCRAVKPPSSYQYPECCEPYIVCT